MTKQYYVYENWRRKRGRTHLAECRYCNHGTGTQSSDSGKNGKWHGPFDRNGAFSAAEEIIKRGVDVQPCAVCAP